MSMKAMKVIAGEPLMDGASNPHDILRVLGENELQRYLVNEVQEVYRLQGVAINDKHIEVIVRQMLRHLIIEDQGDTDFLAGEQVTKKVFNEKNQGSYQRQKATCERPGCSFGDHQIFIEYGKFYFRRLFPGNHQGIDRSECQRQTRQPGGIEGKCNHGPSHSGGYGLQGLFWNTYRRAGNRGS